ncbi:hypothetical protein WR25_04625 [Diploscapter pachys]|uniref:Oxysterol-binding protein n=1 Tax=Diploscapter pachys TaxID=2018661 RepID=A0A2A2JLZ0_9BILA|nr:hypothetical protein WR25_04625 [Diploscapter pachys]
MIQRKADIGNGIASACVDKQQQQRGKGKSVEATVEGDKGKTGNRLMTNFGRRLRKARRNISQCYFPQRRRRSYSDEDFCSAYEFFPNGSPAEVGQSCRGNINLQEARILSDKATNSIVISAASQNFHLKAQNDIDRAQWLKALEYARHRAIKQAESDEDDEAAFGAGEDRALALAQAHKQLESKLNELRTAGGLLEKHSDELVRCLNDPEIERKTLCERATLLKITTAAVVKAAEDFVDFADRGTRKLGKAVMSEQKEKIVLQEQLEALAKQHSSLERAATISGTVVGKLPLSAYSDMEDDEFHDAPEELSIGGDKDSRAGTETSEEGESATTERASAMGSQRATANGSHELAAEQSGNEKSLAKATPGAPRKRRSTIPDRPDLPINLWSIMKNCIGKELSKIPMPVNFSEPLSVLQRITEDLEYAHLLETASDKNPFVQMCYVAAYAVSNYSTTGNRKNKPFNPLLGETYECDRSDDLGWKSLAEQVSHHPPAAAHHAEGRGWIMHQDFTMTSRFRGKYLSVIPVGYTHVLFPGSTNHYTYRKITTTVHNIIVGKLWIDNHGEMEITNHGTGHVLRLKFFPYSYFSREPPRKIFGIVRDSEGHPQYAVQGMWDSYVDMFKVLSYTGSGEKTKVDLEEEGTRIWSINSPPPGFERMHNFSRLAIELNEPEEGVAPTDSRLRPDQRLMEIGKWDESNSKKLEIEEKQRAVRRSREAEAERAVKKGLPYEEYKPFWFTKVNDELTGSLMHKYTHEYWESKEKQDWTRCPNIF